MGISVIIPVYNRAFQVTNALQSVMNQTYTDFECIIIDDASTDRTVQVVSDFIGADPRFQLLVLRTNQGPGAARNAGIQKCHYPFISFLDSDDSYEPDFLEKSMLKMGTLPAYCGFIWTGMRIFYDETRIKKFIWQPPKDLDPYLLFLRELRIGTNSGITIRKSVLEEIGLFDEQLSAAEDTDLFLRVSRKYRFDYLPEYLISINKNSASRLSKNYVKIAEAYNQILPKHMETIRQFRQLRLKYYYKAMWLNYHLGDKWVSRKYFRLLLGDHLLNIKAWLIFAIYELFGKSFGGKVHISLSNSL